MKDDTLLARWLSGELDQKEIAALESSPEYKTLSKIKANFERIESPQFNPDGILKKVLRHEKTPAKAIPLYRKRWLHVAAAAVIILFGIGITFTGPQHEVAVNGERYAFNLPDQSEVILNAGSEAEYSKWSWDSNRKISLQGEAYFKVAKGKKFTVETNMGTVTVLGTQFNVRARGKRFDVTCFEGKVRVIYQSDKILLTPGKSVTFTDSGTELMSKTITSPEWLRHELVFTKETLAGVIAEIERQYKVKIKTSLQSEQLFSGSLPGNDLNTVLTILSTTYHLRIGKNAGVIILSPIESGS